MNKGCFSCGSTDNVEWYGKYAEHFCELCRETDEEEDE